ncbi:MAG: phosphatase PAP2 family protein [bacterium]|nr:phosphatase PAP2 family protein [bacterium]
MSWVIIVLMVVAAVSSGLTLKRAAAGNFRKPVGRMYKKQYSRRGFLTQGIMVTGAAVLVYSGVDEAVDSWHTKSVRSDSTDSAANFLNHIGERKWFFAWAGLAATDVLLASTPLSRWGRKTCESVIVGLPMLWGTQYLLGASRPKETGSPKYDPFNDDNSASGHTFMAAIPMLTLAKSQAPAPAKIAGYLGSLPVGWARMNDRKHYLSQVLLGYGMAWNAVTLQESSNHSENHLQS